MVLCLLSACGYHLRGNIALPDSLKRVYLSNASAELNAAALSVYKSASGELVKTASAAQLVIKIIDEHYQRRSISTGSTGYSNEYELNYRLQFELVNNQGKQLAERQTIEQSKNYYNDQNGTTFISKINEETLLRQELYVDAMRRVLARARAAVIQ